MSTFTAPTVWPRGITREQFFIKRRVSWYEGTDHFFAITKNAAGYKRLLDMIRDNHGVIHSIREVHEIKH